jgi:Dolichyl-phosphate-mannose-protein mannosyltransferase
VKRKTFSLRRWTKRRDVLALAGLIGVSFVLRLLGGLARPTLILIPDEYIYSNLARSLAFHFEPLIRGHLVHFFALGFPLLSAPLWSFGNTELVYELTQALNALIASLAAIPVFLLARELRLRPAARLGVAALALAVPGLTFASFICADVLGYTLCLCASLAAVRALDQPTPRRLVLFFALAALATLTRIQFLVLFPVFLVAWALLSPREIYKLLRRHLVVCATVVLGLAAILVTVGIHSLLGTYAYVLKLGIQPLDTVRWISVNALVLAYAVGVAVVPGALVGFAVSLARPRRRLERAFSLFILLLLVSFLIEAGLFGSNVTHDVEERYVFATLPALGIFFTLAIERGRRLALAVSGVAVVVLVALLHFPLTAYDLSSKVGGSPLLQGVLWMHQRFGPGEAAMIFTTVAAGLLLLGTLAFFVPKLFTPIAIAGAIAFAISFSVMATAYTNARSRIVARTYLPKDFDRIDDLVSRPVGFVATVGTPVSLANELMFWNQSIVDPINLPGSQIMDGFGRHSGTIATDGRLLVDGKPWRGPLLVSGYTSQVELQGARRLLHGVTFDLWQPHGEARFELMITGRYFDGWLTPNNTATVWPDVSGHLQGTLVIELSIPSSIKSEQIEIKTPWDVRRVRLTPGSSRKISIRLRGKGPARFIVRSRRVSQFSDGRFVIAYARFRIESNARTNANVDRATNR